MSFDLERFVQAQQGVYDTALEELHAGAKQSHWMWFIFPQMAGLGRSSTARFYGIASAKEARAYLEHPVLGRRLIACTAAMLTHAGTRPEAILGAIDALKFRSSMTLFEAVANDPTPFAEALEAFYGGARDPETQRLLA